MTTRVATPRGLDDLQLTATAKAALLRIGYKIAKGFEGEVQVLVGNGGGIRSIKWIQTETGDTIKEELL